MNERNSKGKSYNYYAIGILLIEDNIGDARIISELLRDVKDFNFSLTHVQTLNEGLLLLEKSTYDVILLDLGLPDSIGYETISKAREKAQNIPIVILTGSADEKVERIAVQSGIQDYLIKGQIESSPLAKSIYHAIDRHKMIKTIESLAKEVQENERKLNSIIEGNADGIIIVDNQGLIQFVNSAAEKLLSKGKEPLFGTQFKFVLEKGKKKEIEVKDIHDNINYVELNIAEIPWEGQLMNLITLRDITDRKNIENIVKELAKFPSENPAPVLKIDRYKVIYINEAGRTNYGIEIGDDIPTFLKETVIEVITSGATIEKELEINNNYYSLIFKPIEDSTHINIYGMDITGRKKANIALKESEIKFRSLIENLDSGIICMDKKGIFTIVNEKAARIRGKKPQDFLGKSIFEVFPREIAEQEQNINIDIFRSGKGIIYEETFDSPDGNKTFFVNKQPLMDDKGEIIGIQNVMLDVTKVKESEQEVKKLEETLFELNALLEHAPLAIFLIDKTGKILRANEIAKVLLESNNDILNYNIYDFFNSDSKVKMIKYYKEDVYNPGVRDNVEAKIKTIRGNTIDVEIYSTIIKIADNIIIQSFFSDISKRKAFEMHREQLLDELITNLEFKSKFLATISHELRTPLNAILGFSELLLEGSYGEINPEQADFLNDILSAGNHLLNLINSILDISKIDAGKFELNIKSSNLINVIKEAENMLSPLLRKKNIEISINGVSEDATVPVDELRFKQIIFNLLSNSVKFTNEGFINIKVIEKKSLWEFQMKDTGIGIAKEDFPIIFKEFGRIENDTTRTIPGIGLGLALTKRLINLHGGEIWFESELGKGTTFYFTIPKNESCAINN